MSRRTDGSGPSFEDALVDALCGLLEVDDEQVAVKVDAPGLGLLTGRLTLKLTVTEEATTVAAATPEAAGAMTSDVGTITAEVVEEEAAEGPDEVVEEIVEEAAEGRDEVVEEIVEEAAEGRDEVAEEAAGPDDVAREGTEGPEVGDEPTEEDLSAEAEVAADFLEGLLDALDLPGDIHIRLGDDFADVEVVEIGSGALIGRRGQTLEAIQELARCALQREFQRRSRVRIDAEGYRARRLEKLLEKAEEAIDEVLERGEPVRLEPMDVFERKAVHQLVASIDGLTSRSQGREPARRVIVEPE